MYNFNNNSNQNKKKKVINLSKMAKTHNNSRNDSPE